MLRLKVYKSVSANVSIKTGIKYKVLYVYLQYTQLLTIFFLHRTHKPIKQILNDKTACKLRHNIEYLHIAVY